MIDELLRPFDFEFFRNGLLVATMAGALCGAIGVYVVLKGMSYTARMDALLTVVLACSILATMQVLGVTLVAAVLVIPAASARMLTNSFARMLALATAIGAVCGFVGMNLSYHLDVQSGPTIVLVAATRFAAVFVATGITAWRRAAAISARSPLAAR